MRQYLLSRDVYLCTMLDTAVLLDVRTDQYHGLNREQTRVLAAIVQGWPGPAEKANVDPNERSTSKADEALVNELLRLKLLTLNPGEGKTAAPARLNHPELKLYEWDGSDLSAVHCKAVWRFACAYARVLWSLRVHPLRHALDRVRSRRNADSMRILDIDLARELCRQFRLLRPLFYTAADRCLMDSLVLAEFLSSYGVHATFVIGVRTMPFGAHSWVQHGKFVLNGPPGYVSAFTPVLTA